MMARAEHTRRSFQALRRRAEAFLHELNVCQVELEMQNDELRRAQEELSAVRDEFADLFHMAPLGYMTLGGDETIVRANRETATLLGVPQDALVGQRFERFAADEEAKKAYYVWRVSAKREQDAAPLELRLTRADTTPFVARLRGRRRGAGLWLTLEDVTTRKKDETHSALSARVLEYLNGAQRPSDILGEVCHVLRETMALFGVGIRLREGEDYPYKAVDGLPPEIAKNESSLLVQGPSGLLRDPAGRPVLACMCGCVLRGGLDPLQPGCTPGGSFFANRSSELLQAAAHHKCEIQQHDRCMADGYESIALVPIRCGSDVLGLLQLIDPRPGRFDDETVALLERLAGVLATALARQRAEEVRRELELSMLQTQKLESLGVLVGGIAHDFNNLLTPILGNVQVALLDLEPGSVLRTTLSEIETAAKNAAQLIRRMLVYAGHAPVELQYVDLSEVLAQMRPLLDRAVCKTATLQYVLGRDLAAVHADPSQLQQIAMNLVLNGSEALGETPGVVRIEVGEATADQETLRGCEVFATPLEGRCVYLRITDSGCGMDAHTRGKLFDPFFSTKFVGRGLGLAAVRSIVRSHRGALKVESEPNQGSTFTVLFPGCESPVRPQAHETTRPRSGQRSGTVLVVDDEQIVRDFISRALTRFGYRVLRANTAREAVAVFDAHKAEVDCVLLDYTMPDADGMWAFRELLKLRSDARVILCSGHGSDFLAQHQDAAGLAGFLSKPCGVDVMLKKIDEVLKR
jgi:signal transduction histidine kinase/PAS domain-containing protein